MPVRFNRSAFACIPVDLIRELGPRKNIGWLYLHLHIHGNASPDGAWASIATLARECHMDQKDVKAGLRWLLDNGWIVRRQRPGQTSSYFIRMDTPTDDMRATAAIHGPGKACAPHVKPTWGGNAPQVGNAPQGGNDPHHLGGKCPPPPGGEMPPTNKNPLTRSHEPELNPNPPLTPPCGGDGLTADQPSAQALSITVSGGQVEQPTAAPSDSPPAASPLAAQPQLHQQPNAAAPIKARRSRTTRSSNAQSDDDARLLIAIWNENRPAGWSALTCMTAARWEVVDHWCAALGGFETFLQALPVALANAGRDRFWCAPGHGWNSFMGYGAKTGKAHFLTFLEQEQAYAPTVNRDGSLTFLGGVIQHSHNPTPKFF